MACKAAGNCMDVAVKAPPPVDYNDFGKRPFFNRPAKIAEGVFKVVHPLGINGMAATAPDVFAKQCAAIHKTIGAKGFNHILEKPEKLKKCPLPPLRCWPLKLQKILRTIKLTINPEHT